MLSGGSGRGACTWSKVQVRAASAGLSQVTSKESVALRFTIWNSPNARLVEYKGRPVIFGPDLEVRSPRAPGGGKVFTSGAHHRRPFPQIQRASIAGYRAGRRKPASGH